MAEQMTLCLALAALSMVLFFSNRAMLQGMTTAMEQLAEIEERRAVTADFSALEELHTHHLQLTLVLLTDGIVDNLSSDAWSCREQYQDYYDAVSGCSNCHHHTERALPSTRHGGQFECGPTVANHLNHIDMVIEMATRLGWGDIKRVASFHKKYFINFEGLSPQSIEQKEKERRQKELDDAVKDGFWIYIEETEELYPSEFFNHPRYERKIDFLIRRYHDASFYVKGNLVGLPWTNPRWGWNPDYEWIQKSCPSTRFGQCMDSILYYRDVEFKAGKGDLEIDPYRYTIFSDMRDQSEEGCQSENKKSEPAGRGMRDQSEERHQSKMEAKRKRHPHPGIEFPPGM